MRTGDWIGTTGNRGTSTAPHLHMEVYEWFPRDEDRDTSRGWQRVDPVSVFPAHAFQEEGYDGTADVIATGLAAAVFAGLGRESWKRFFRPYTRFPVRED